MHGTRGEKESSERKRGVILLNMGGPQRPEEVAAFLYNLFSDRDIIRLGPAFLQKPIAWYIARKRTPKSMATYNRIGGGSPLIRITNEQAAALQEELKDAGDFVVVSAMRYCRPTAEQALKALAARGISSIIALPLYPHYSRATSGSSLADLRRAMARSHTPFQLTEIHGWPESPLYIQCLADNIRKGLDAFAPDDAALLYSAHSLPVSFIREGDPYLDHLQVTIAKVEEITGVAGRLCFQSRSGPVEWLSPSTPELLDRLAAEGCRNVLIVPISFVSDHVETLYEIDILYRDMARERGMRSLSCESLNCNPAFIKSLKELVLAQLR